MPSGVVDVEGLVLDEGLFAMFEDENLAKVLVRFFSRKRLDQAAVRRIRFFLDQIGQNRFQRVLLLASSSLLERIKEHLVDLPSGELLTQVQCICNVTRIPEVCQRLIRKGKVDNLPAPA